MVTTTTNKAWAKSEAADTYQTTRTGINTTLDAIDALLKKIYASGDNVGIGIAAPEHPLDVAGNVWIKRSNYGMLLRSEVVSADERSGFSCIAQGSHHFWMNAISNFATGFFGWYNAAGDPLATIAGRTVANYTPMMVLNAGGNLGIGTASPVSDLEVQDGLTTTGAVVTLSSKETSTVLNDILGRINFRAALDAAGTDAILPGASIAAIAENTFSASVNETGLQFSTGASETAVERMRINHHGYVGIGTSDPAFPLDIYKDENAPAVMIFTNPNTGNAAQAGFGFKNQVGWDGYMSGGITSAANAALAGSAYIWTKGSDFYLGTNDEKPVYLFTNANTNKRITILGTGLVGIGTVAPASPLAVNRQADDGVIIDLEQADSVEGTISVSDTTVSYNAFVGSHYTQLKAAQAELPVGAVVISTGDIVPCERTNRIKTEVPKSEALTQVTKAEARESHQITVEDTTNIISSHTEYFYDSETNLETEQIVNVYGTKTETKKRLREGYYHDKTNGLFYKIADGVTSNNGTFYRLTIEVISVPSKEYFPYVKTTTNAGDGRVYGVWMSKMREDAEGLSFGKNNKPVYLIAQVGLFKIRVTDTNGNIANGDYLETSTRAMEAQKQTATGRKNSTISKALIDVDWETVAIDPVLGYKWKLIPCIF